MELAPLPSIIPWQPLHPSVPHESTVQQRNYCNFIRGIKMQGFKVLTQHLQSRQCAKVKNRSCQCILWGLHAAVQSKYNLEHKQYSVYLSSCGISVLYLHASLFKKLNQTHKNKKPRELISTQKISHKHNNKNLSCYGNSHLACK